MLIGTHMRAHKHTFIANSLSLYGVGRGLAISPHFLGLRWFFSFLFFTFFWVRVMGWDLWCADSSSSHYVSGGISFHLILSLMYYLLSLIHAYVVNFFPAWYLDYLAAMKIIRFSGSCDLIYYFEGRSEQVWIWIHHMIIWRLIFLVRQNRCMKFQRSSPYYNNINISTLKLYSTWTHLQTAI